MDLCCKEVWHQSRETDLRHRAPILIFLSDGESHIGDKPMQDICRAAVSRGFVII
jgi:hypothetical protein